MTHRSLVPCQSLTKKPAASSGSDTRKLSESKLLTNSILQTTNPSALLLKPIVSVPEELVVSCDHDNADVSVIAIKVADRTLADAQRGNRKHPLRMTETPVSNSTDTARTDSALMEKMDRESPGETAGTLKDDLVHLVDSLRQEFKNSLVELQAAQSAAVTAQNEVLKSLTEVVRQSSAVHDVSPELLERALSGVEDRLVSRLEAVTKSASSAESLSIESGKKVVSKTAGSSNHIKLQNAASSVSRSWEQIRSEMMAKGEVSETPAMKGSPSSERLHEVTQLSSDRHFRLPEQDPSLETPKSVDPESVTVAELRDAFREREVFIATLIARIRRQQEMATGQLSAEQLRTLVAELPEELANQVKHTLKQMDDLARMGELELSMERARIARQLNELEHSRMIIERNARQLGWALNPNGTISPPAQQLARTSSSSRRWLGKLGFGQ